MGFRRFLLKSAGRADLGLPAAARTETIESEDTEPLAPEQLAELQETWAELARAAEGSGVSDFHACTRTGTSWEDDPVTVRAIAATLRTHRTDQTPEEVLDERDE
jgi:hypothetical protein